MVCLAGLCALFDTGKVLGVAAVAVGAAAAVGVNFKFVVTDHPSVHGIVRCASGDPVVGVFVRGTGGDAGFAGWAPAGPESRASYTFTLQHRSKLRLGIGCGGSQQNWRADLVTAFIGVGRHDFVCRDAELTGDRIYDRCRAS